jgi:hypothetical protein
MLSSPLSTHINIPCYNPLLSFDVIAHCYHLLIISPFTVSTMLLPSCYRQCDPNTYKKSKDKTPIDKALKTKRRQDKTSTTFFFSMFWHLMFCHLTFCLLKFCMCTGPMLSSHFIIQFYHLGDNSIHFYSYRKLQSLDVKLCKTPKISMTCTRYTYMNFAVAIVSVLFSLVWN